MEDRFDVVPVRVNDERCVIPSVGTRTKADAVVAAAGLDSGAVEHVNGGSVCCDEGHMSGSGWGLPFPDPEQIVPPTGPAVEPAGPIAEWAALCLGWGAWVGAGPTPERRRRLRLRLRRSPEHRRRSVRTCEPA
jgi:hypothetical protein